MMKASDGTFTLNIQDAALMRERNYRKHLAEFYQIAEQEMLRFGDIEPEEGKETPENPGPKDSSAAVEDTRPLAERLTAARRKVFAKYDYLSELRIRYPADFDRYLSTYEKDDEADSSDDDRSPSRWFDREYVAQIEDTNTSIRNAEANHWELRNQALEEKVYDLGEFDLFGGILDHPSDGRTESESTAWRKRRAVRTAGSGPRTKSWLRGARGLAKQISIPPLDVANISNGDNYSARNARSQDFDSVGHRGLLDRWAAEQLVLEEEIKGQMQKLQEDIAAGRTWYDKDLMRSGLDQARPSSTAE